MFYAILSDKNRILVQDSVEDGADASYSLFSIKENAPIWQRYLTGMSSEKVDIRGIVLTPDNSMAVLSTVDMDIILRLISVEDGTIIKEVNTGPEEINGAFPSMKLVLINRLPL